MDKQIQEETNKISKHEFYFETPLYDVIENTKLDDDLFYGDVDAYNSASGFDTTYEINKNLISSRNNYGNDSSFKKFFIVILTCKRKGVDELKFFVYRDDKITVKVGQWPSMVDIQFAEIDKKYDGLLSKEALKEFKRAIGLVTYGVGVGSFVYLRRIFENLIYEVFGGYKQINVAKEDFSKKRMEEKIDVLKNYLPS